MSKKYFYITTAIAYLNGSPHLGHALEIIQADCIARFYRQLVKDVVFQTGSDEHGIKIFNAAKESRMNVEDFINQYHEQFIRLYKILNVSHDYYVRTTSSVHKRGASKLWLKMVENGDLYKSTYKGFYCIGCESFKTSKELVDGICPYHPNRPLIEIEEENYFFNLSKYVNRLIEIYEKDEIRIVPKKRKAEILAILKSELTDVSFSRQKNKMPWGIPVPNDPSHVMYVWADALSNYITNIGYEYDEDKFNSIWPADVHLIGKDIIKFHAIYWPAMLISAGIKVPKNLFVHGFVTLEGLKIGKSLGNVIDPFFLIEKYGSAPFRFYLLKNIPSNDDGSFNVDNLIETYNSALADQLGNLILRVLSFIERDFNGEIPALHDLDKIDEEFIRKFNFMEQLRNFMENFQLNKALDRVWEFIRDTNKYINDTEPWEIRKRGNIKRLSTVLYVLVEALRVISIYIHPFIPSISDKMFTFIGLEPLMDFSNVDFKTDTKGRIGKKEILFPKMQLEKKKNPLQMYDFRVGKVLEAEIHPEIKDFYILKIDIKEKIITVCAKLVPDYKKEELIQEPLVVLTNIKPRKIGGILSEGMLLGGKGSNEKMEIARIKGEPGEQIYIGDLEPMPETITMKRFRKAKIYSSSQKIKIEDKFLKTKGEFARINLKDNVKLT
ncbi:MAG: methionine--tRNA ligase [Candidatus Helarchaeota archaeon]